MSDQRGMLFKNLNHLKERHGSILIRASMILVVLEQIFMHIANVGQVLPMERVAKRKCEPFMIIWAMMYIH